MRKIKIAQIGVNSHSHSNYVFKSLRLHPDLFEIVGYALPENEKERLPNKVSYLEKFSRELTLEEILSNPEIEAVTIETDEVYLTKYALMAAKAGKHIHMEKPGGTYLPDFEELISIMKQTGKVFSTGYMYRHNPFVKELMEKIKRGDLGEIISVEAQMNCIHPLTVRDWLKDFPGGMLFFLGCHLIDLILQIQGQPERIIPLSKSTRQGTDAADYGMAVLEYKNGISFAKSCAMEIGGFERRQLVVTGTKGTVELKPFEILIDRSKICTRKTEYTSTVWADRGEVVDSKEYERYDVMMLAFADYILGVKENPYTLDYELELYRTLLKCCGVD